MHIKHTVHNSISMSSNRKVNKKGTRIRNRHPKVTTSSKYAGAYHNQVRKSSILYILFKVSIVLIHDNPPTKPQRRWHSQRTWALV
jgi:hypothetical protein